MFNNFKGVLRSPMSTVNAEPKYPEPMVLGPMLDLKPSMDQNWRKVAEMEDYLEHEEEVRADLVRLDVYFESMTATNIIEEAKYTV